jgi:G:T/U-mismatch repair DNA glycosylase
MKKSSMGPFFPLFYQKESVTLMPMQKQKKAADEMTIERHPLEPFLPTEARLLMLGSFPPPMKRWCMHFYYPNYINDMWRIMGLVFFNDKNHFVDVDAKTFRKADIIRFLEQRGIAIFDTACAVNRLQDNASDKFLEVVESTDVAALLRRLPQCTAIVTTGQKATDTLISRFKIMEPKVGTFSEWTFEDRTMRLYRMPSSSRAYPLALEKKAANYDLMMQEMNIR